LLPSRFVPHNPLRSHFAVVKTDLARDDTPAQEWYAETHVTGAAPGGKRTERREHRQKAKT